MLLAKEQRHQPLTLMITIITRAASGPILIRLHSQCSSFILPNQSRALASFTTENLVLPVFFSSYFFTYFSSSALFCLCLGFHFLFFRREITNAEPRFCLNPRLNFLSTCLPSGSTISVQHSIHSTSKRPFNFSPSSPTCLHNLPVF